MISRISQPRKFGADVSQHTSRFDRDFAPDRRWSTQKCRKRSARAGASAHMIDEVGLVQFDKVV